jgi:cellulose synthase/poly-beta-1,6-N-acetylglucosamine synthase-like glycosyltransferase
MEQILWSLKARDHFTLAWPIIIGIVLGLILYNFDILTIAILRAWQGLIRGDGSYCKFTPMPKGQGKRPTALVIIPSLLRNMEDYNSYINSIESCAKNEYPDELTIVVSVDGSEENPKLFQNLKDWIKAQSYPNNVRVRVCHNKVRLGKIMAVEKGFQYMKSLVAAGEYTEVPTLYFSVDADSTLSENALERLASRIMTPHPITKNLRRAVAGQTCVHMHEFWQGWKKYFTIQGQIYLSTARQYLFYGMYRYNYNILPFISLPGPLYCTWSYVMLEAPHYMGYLQRIKLVDFFKWWVGVPCPTYKGHEEKPLAESLGGNTDDTAVSIVLSITSWRNGKLVFEQPRTPLHAFGRMLWAWFVERSLDYDPDAKVWTYTPSTIKGLWSQRTRWNSCRVECAGRYFKAFLFHWNVAFPYMFQLAKVIFIVLRGVIVFGLLPFVLFGNIGIVATMIMGFTVSVISCVIYTLVALALDSERRKFWRMIFAVPFDGIYSLVFGFATASNGVIKDIFGYGINTRFIPEETLIIGRSQRIAIAYRVRRFITMCIRSIRYADVPYGSWWFGFRENLPYVQSGYKGWTSGKKKHYLIP